MTTNVPVRWDEELARMAKAQASIERPPVGKLTIRGGVLQYMGTPIPGNKLSVIIVGNAFENALYRNIIENRAYDPNNPETPICFALSQTGENMAPHATSIKPASANCAACNYNAFGSDPKGGRGKACKQVRRLVVIPANAISAGPDQVKKSECATMNIPVTSVANWAKYVQGLSTDPNFMRPAWAVITEISVVPHQKNQFEVKFAPVQNVPDSYLQPLYERTESANAQAMIPYAPPNLNTPTQQAAPNFNRKF